MVFLCTTKSSYEDRGSAAAAAHSYPLSSGEEKSPTVLQHRYATQCGFFQPGFPPKELLYFPNLAILLEDFFLAHRSRRPAVMEKQPKIFRPNSPPPHQHFTKQINFVLDTWKMVRNLNVQSPNLTPSPYSSSAQYLASVLKSILYDDAPATTSLVIDI